MVCNTFLHPELDLLTESLGCFSLHALRVNNICPEFAMSITSGREGTLRNPHLGSSVASISEWTPMTAASRISGWVRRTLSSSAGGTIIKIQSPHDGLVLINANTPWKPCSRPRVRTMNLGKERIKPRDRTLNLISSF